MASYEEIRETLEAYFRGLAHVLGESAEIEIEAQSDREITLNVRGVEALRSADIQALNALGYLAEIAVRRRTGAAIRLHLDVNGQRARRQAQLRELALRRAEEALHEARRVELEPMEAEERKLIHETLSDYEGIRTYSRGRGTGRHVIIEPVADPSRTPS
jgi:spoIIIJ-associated protein